MPNYAPKGYKHHKKLLRKNLSTSHGFDQKVHVLIKKYCNGGVRNLCNATLLYKSIRKFLGIHKANKVDIICLVYVKTRFYVR